MSNVSKTKKLVFLEFPAIETTTMRIVVADTEFVIDSVPCIRRGGEVFFSCQDWEHAEYMVAQNLVERKIVTGETFRFIRKAIGWGLKDFARVLWHPETFPNPEETIRSWESGAAPVDLAVWEKLADRVKGEPAREDPELTNAEAMAEVRQEE